MVEVYSSDGTEKNGYFRSTNDAQSFVVERANGRLHGFTNKMWNTGATYQGGYKNPYQDGYGSWTSADGKVVKVGVWKENKFVSDKKVYTDKE